MPRVTPLLVACGLVALVVVPAGLAKLAGVPQLHQSFAQLGLPAWFGYAIGACEVLGGVGVWVPRVRALAAMGLAVIMAGALYYHATFTPLVQGLPALLVLGLSIYIAGAARRAPPIAHRS